MADTKKDLTIIVLTRNDEEVIDKCLASLSSLSSEVLVVDSESTDSTIKKAKQYGVKIFEHKFENFSEQRNFAASKVSTDWFIYLDSDEVITPNFIEEIKQALSAPTNNGYFIRRKTFYFGKDWGLTDSVQRLFLKEKFKGWHGVVHETPKIEGEFGIIESPVLHFTHRNLSQMLSKTNEWSEYEARLRFESTHPQMNILRFVRVIATGFFDSYFKGRGYANGTAGIVESTFQGFSMFITYAKLWELQNKKKVSEKQKQNKAEQ